jgi:hypothetical protein
MAKVLGINIKSEFILQIEVIKRFISECEILDGEDISKWTKEVIINVLKN